MSKLFVFAEYDIVAAAKGHVLHRNFMTVKQELQLDLTLLETLAGVSTEVAKAVLESQTDEIAKNAFIAQLRTDTQLKRNLGGVRWIVRARGFSVGTSFEDIVEQMRRDIVRSQKERKYAEDVRLSDLFYEAYMAAKLAQVEQADAVQA